MRKTIVLLALALLACGEKAAQEVHPADHAAAKPSADHSAHGGLPEGHAEVEIPVDRQQVIGLKLAPAERTRVDATVRASAIVQADEKPM